MGLIFDIHSAKRYESWHTSPQGVAMDHFFQAYTPLLLEPLSGDRVLDIGCGSGNHLYYLKQLGLHITGVDASPYMISKAKERLGGGCMLKTGMAEDLPFEDNEFDLAIFVNTLEFLNDPFQALREAGRVARRKILINVINSFSWYDLAYKLRGLYHDFHLIHFNSFNLWQLKSGIYTIFGRVPIIWKSTPFFPTLFEKMSRFFPYFRQYAHCPFGSFLGISFNITYTIKTNNLPLKIRTNKAGQSITSGVTPVGQIKRTEENERGLSL